MMSGVLMIWVLFRNMVGRTRQVQYRSEVGQGSGMAGTESTQDPPPSSVFPAPLPPLAPILAPVMIRAE